MKIYLYSLLGCLLLGFVATTNVRAQGCVAVKNMTSHSLNFGDDNPTGWQFSLNYRYFRSFRHFKGTEEQKERLVNKNEVINNDNSVNFGVTYNISDKWSVGASIPYIYIDRSSLYEHDRVNRYHSQSNGLGDIRLVGYRSFHSEKIGTLQIGLGVKLPTGNYNYKDHFQTPEGPQLRPVDQSVQLGDGGTGIVLEFNAIKAISHKTSLYLNSMYLFNPRNTNGTRTFRETLSPLLANEAIMSVADQYFIRIGGQYQINEKLFFGIGGRVEGIPVEDILGKSEGFRRPGYIVSAEPSIGYAAGHHFFGVNVPVALVRNRTQSLTDQETQELTGVPRHGDAAFADYLISFTYTFQLSH